jgi:type VII secretion integral membrane protein EccD
VPHSSTIENLLVPILALLWGVLFNAAGWLLSRRYREDALANVLCWCATPLIFVGTLAAVPGPIGVSHVWAGCFVVFVFAMISSRLAPGGIVLHTAVATFTRVLGLALVDIDFFHHSYQVIGGILVCVSIFLISSASKFTVALAKLPLPPVPTAGQAVDAEEIDLHPSVEGIGAIGAMALPNAKDLEQRAKAANNYLTGIVIAASLLAIGGALAAAMPTEDYPWQGPVLGFIVSVVLVLRGRSFTDLTQAAVMISAGLLLFLLLVFGAATHGATWLALAFGTGLILFAIAFLLIGVVVPTQTYSPVMRRAGEVFEYALIAVIFPLVFWLMGLYAAARNISL